MPASPYGIRLHGTFKGGENWGGFAAVSAPLSVNFTRCFFIGRTWRPSESIPLLSLAATRSLERYRLFSLAAYWA